MSIKETTERRSAADDVKRILYSKHGMNILSALLTLAFFLVPVLLLGMEFTLFMLVLMAVSGMLFGGLRIDPGNLQGVVPVSAGSNPDLQHIIDGLSRRAGLERSPDLYMSNSPIANAAAVETTRGPGIIVSSSLFSSLPREEIEAVLAHEFMHIKNRDLLLLNLLARFRMIYTRIPSMLGLLILFAPLLLFFLPLLSALLILSIGGFAAVILERAVMRLREYGADYGAVKISTNPRALASALNRLDWMQQRMSWSMFGGRTPESGGGAALERLLRSHPETSKRVEKIQSWLEG